MTMRETRNSLAPPMVSMLASVVIVSLIVVSGVGYAWSTPEGGTPSPSLTLEVTSISKMSGPSYDALSVTSPLPSSAATFKLGPFAPGDSVVVSYTVKNIGAIPASLSALGVSVSPSKSGFTATNGPIPPSLGPGASFSSTITITFASGLGNSYEGSTAIVTLQINGMGTTTTCTNTITHTSTVTKTVTKTVTTTRTVTSAKTLTVTKTTTKDGYQAPDVADSLISTTSCVSATITTTVTATRTLTTTSTQTVTLTTTATVTWTATITKTKTCTAHGLG